MISGGVASALRLFSCPDGSYPEGGRVWRWHTVASQPAQRAGSVAHNSRYRFILYAYRFISRAGGYPDMGRSAKPICAPHPPWPSGRVRGWPNSMRYSGSHGCGSHAFFPVPQQSGFNKSLPPGFWLRSLEKKKIKKVYGGGEVPRCGEGLDGRRVTGGTL